MIIVLTVLHVIVSLVLILVVLLQTGKRADLAGAFGGGGSQTAFGTRGAATLLSKVTTACAVLFMVTSLSLSILLSQSEGGSGTVLSDVPAENSAPASDTGTADDSLDLPPLPEEPAVSDEVPAQSGDDATEPQP